MLVVREREALDVILLLPVEEVVAEPVEEGLKVVLEKPQERTTSSTSGKKCQVLTYMERKERVRKLTILVIIIVVIPVILANTGSACRELEAGILSAANTIDLGAITAVLLITSPRGVDHGLADGPALLRNVVVIELLSSNTESRQADENDGVFGKHCRDCDSLFLLVQWDRRCRLV